jgi:hypothetical protein
MTDCYFVPAAPGFWVLQLVHPDTPGEEFGVYHEPVVAWRCSWETEAEEDGYALPVMAAADLPILGPDGMVRTLLSRTFASEADWLKDASAEARKKEKARG